MGAEGPLVGPPVFKTDGDGAPVLVCSIRTRPRQLRTARPAVRGSRLGGRPAGGQLRKEFAAMSDVPFFARRKLYSTYSAQEVGQLRAALQGAGVEFTIKQDSHPVGGTGYGNVTSAITLGAGAAPFEYTVYVHKDDFALAESAIQGSCE